MTIFLILNTIYFALKNLITFIPKNTFNNTDEKLSIHFMGFPVSYYLALCILHQTRTFKISCELKLSKKIIRPGTTADLVRAGSSQPPGQNFVASRRRLQKNVSGVCIDRINNFLRFSENLRGQN